MRLYTPDNLLYPITVTKLLRQPGEEIEINAPLFVYEYKSTVKEFDPDTREDRDVERTWPSNFESEYEGKLSSLEVHVGQGLTRRTYVGEIEENCQHEMQFRGICAICGKDLTLTDHYNTTVRDVSRATVNTVHGRTELLISEAVASKADEEAKRRLLDARRLSLVVDLDQTIIHATVDPTVAEWQQDESNPNHEAVKDVRAFQLADDFPGLRNTWYYIKLRPGLKEFLEDMSKYYELHIYTMGTRAYAENIAHIIDPDRKIFGDRVLSRDESGSQSAKKLSRLFPVDTKMVVIIDDRADVWHWIPNLVKVPVYDFFVGIGDINSSFLPKRPELEPKPANTADAVASSGSNIGESNGQTDANGSPIQSSPPSTNGDRSVVDQLVSMAGSQDAGSMKEKTEQQDQTLVAQLEDRPLLQKQKILEAAEEEEAKTSPAVEAATEILTENGDASTQASNEAGAHHKYRHNLLQDDDTELTHLGDSLRKIHAAFFEEYDKDESGSKGGRISELRPGPSKKRAMHELRAVPDAALIMNTLKSKVLAGVNIVFTGVIPLGYDLQTFDTVLWAKTFGATVSENITRRTTHVIASPERRTAKVRQAAKKPNRIAIVSQTWLFACFSRWQKVDEDPFRIHSDAPANGAGGLPDSLEGKDLPLSSSDEEAAQTEEEGDESAPNGAAAASFPNRTLTLDTETDTEAELEQYAPSLPRKDSSPTEAENADQWGDIDEEWREFMGSDAEDESETESAGTGEDDGAAAGLTLNPKTPPSQRKRKRDALDAEDGVDVGGVEPEPPSSRLQKRKKEAAARTSSLTNMAYGGAEGDDEVGEQGEGDEELDLDLEAALAAEMERQSEEEEAAAEGSTADD